MRLAGDLVALAMLVAAAAGLASFVALRRRPGTPVGTAGWHAAHHTDGDSTVVSVELRQPLSDGSSRVVERRGLGQVRNDDADYDRRLAELMDTARQRAFLLDTQSDE